MGTWLRRRALAAAAAAASAGTSSQWAQSSAGSAANGVASRVVRRRGRGPELGTPPQQGNLEHAPKTHRLGGGREGADILRRRAGDLQAVEGRDGGGSETIVKKGERRRRRCPRPSPAAA